MRIKNIDGLSAANLQTEVTKGGRFIYYPFVISLVVVTFKRTSGVYLVRGNEKTAVKGWPFILTSMLLGWWGIPFGPLYTLESLRINMKGGKDVTDEVMATVAGHLLFQEAQKQKTVHS